MTSNPKAWNQKLSAREKFWCQMCRKQCKDQNGFDMHCKSKAHVEAMGVFSKDPQKYIAKFSEEFERGFLEVLSVKHSFAQVMLKVVYSQYIGDSMQHARLTATKWQTIHEFVREMEQKGKLKIGETIDPLSKAVLYTVRLVDTARIRKEKEAEDAVVSAAMLREREEVALQKEYKKRYDAILRLGGEEKPEEAEPQEYVKNADITMNIGGGGSGEVKQKNLAIFDDPEDPQPKKKKQKKTTPPPPPPPPQDEAPWVLPGITVKILHPTLSGGKYHTKKGVVESVQGHKATVKVVDPAATLGLDQAFLQTVIPKPGRRVQILHGSRRGVEGTLERMLEAEYSAVVRDDAGTAHTLKYEGFSKV